jgi:hypothetical protein
LIYISAPRKIVITAKARFFQIISCAMQAQGWFDTSPAPICSFAVAFSLTLPDNRAGRPKDWAKFGFASPMQRRDERELRDELVNLRAEHRQLDSEIVALEASPTADQLLVKRLKKKKLILKDRITSIEDRLLPDIIA